MSVIHNLLPLWLLILFGTIIAVLFNAGTVLACISLGVRFTKIAVFYGKPVLTMNTRFGPICFGYIPTGGYIQSDMDAFPFQPRLKRAAVALSGPVTLLLSAPLCLGLNHAAQSFRALRSLAAMAACPVTVPPAWPGRIGGTGSWLVRHAPRTRPGCTGRGQSGSKSHVKIELGVRVGHIRCRAAGARCPAAVCRVRHT
jgi:hypothetical protein